MRGFDPEATAPVRRFPQDARADGRSVPDAEAPSSTTPTTDAPTPASAPEAEPLTAGAAAVVQAGAARTEPARARPEPVVLPDTTTDEQDIGWGDGPEPSDDDRYLREVPPHHGS